MNLSVRELSERPEFTAAAGAEGLNAAITGVYVCDLLSWAMSGVSESDAWITVQGHINVVAVAALTNAACVIIADGAALEKDAAAKAEAQGIPILTTKLNAYNAAKLLSAYD